MSMTDICCVPPDPRSTPRHRALWIFVGAACFLTKHLTAELTTLFVVLLINGCAFGPKKASKVEKPSSRGVNSLYRWSLMLLTVLMPLCALCTHVCVSTTLCLLSFAWLPHCWSFPELGPMTQISASLLSHLDNINERTNRIGDLTRHRVSSCQPN